MRSVAALVILALPPAPPHIAQAPDSYPDRVEIRRTAYGVPHVLARDFGALGYGMAWAQLEDFGFRVIANLIRARGQLARYYGRDSLESDVHFRQTHRFAVEGFDRLDQDTRDLMAGWAAAANRYVELHPDLVPPWTPRDFTAHDAAALWVDETIEPKVRVFLQDAGSNAWAFAPERTTSGRAVLLRNPHLGWEPGWDNRYYELHITVPGAINFYGDFRIGFPLYFNGGFNESLGWATTNNYADLEEIYALDVDPVLPDHYRFDGEPVPLERIPLDIEWKNGDGLSIERREILRTPLGPVVERGEGKVYVVRSPEWGEIRKAEQFLKMMRARTLDEWKAAVRMRAHVEQNLTYADRAGNVYYIWNASIPRRPGPSGGDTIAIPARVSGDVWKELWSFDSLPQLLNPPGGYIQNANDPFHFTNLNAVLDSTRWPDYFPRPELGLRSQSSLRLVTQQRKVSLEDVIRLKHDVRMLLAERVRDDLIAALRGTNLSGESVEAAALLEQWDGTVGPESRGGALFETWFRHYMAQDSANPGSYDERWARAFRVPWSPAEPVTTPRGLSNPGRAVASLAPALDEMKADWGRWDVAWGDVHRMRRGDLDLPIGGCSGQLGCFRVIQFRPSADTLWVANRGDAWILAVEFRREGPRAFSVLAYGQSDDPASPHFADQAEMFARGELKRVAFSEQEIARGLVRRYRPGR
jgi:acyl-homoserine-lactone acylase